jgi:hypothetical protein
MAKRGRTIELGDLVVMAHTEADRLMPDPTIASIVAARVVQRILRARENRRTARELVALS